MLPDFDPFLPKFHFILPNFYFAPPWGIFVSSLDIYDFLRRRASLQQITRLIGALICEV